MKYIKKYKYGIISVILFGGLISIGLSMDAHPTFFCHSWFAYQLESMNYNDLAEESIKKGDLIKAKEYLDKSLEYKNISISMRVDKEMAEYKEQSKIDSVKQSLK